MISQGPETYKVFLQGRDLVLTIEEVDKLNKEKRIKPDTRIYNNETKSWIDFGDYQRLHRILNTDSKKGPLIEKERIQPGTTTYQVSLEGKYQTLTIYQVDKLLKEGRIKPDTKVYNNETGIWIIFKEYGRLYKSLMLFNSTKTYQPETKQASVDTRYLQECSKCQHLYSKRAEKCPKCGNTVSVTCNICKAEIPKSSTSCPECGDPKPFDEIRPKQVKTYNSIHQDDSSETPQGPKGMGGWLSFLVAQMMVIGPVWAGMQTLGAFSLSEEKYPYLTDSDHWAYYKAMTWVAFGISSLISFVGGCELLQLHKGSSVRKAKIILVITGPVAHLVYAYIIPYLCLGKAESGPSRIIGQLILALIPTVIWISYLSRSKRVRNTYIKTPNPICING